MVYLSTAMYYLSRRRPRRAMLSAGWDQGHPKENWEGKLEARLQGRAPAICYLQVQVTRMFIMFVM